MIDLLISIPGPLFLFIFTGLAIVCILFAKWLRIQDGSDYYPMPEPDALNSFELAALRGGKNEVIRTAVFDLWHQDMIELKGEKRKTKIKSISGKKPEGAVHKAIYQLTKTARKTSELFSDMGLNQYIGIQLKPVDEKLEKLHLLRNDAQEKRARNIFRVTFAIIFGIGGMKLILGIMRGRPVIFLSILLIIFFFVWLKSLSPGKSRTTHLGKRYLKYVRDHFNWLKHSVKKDEFPDGIDPAFCIALFGAEIFLDNGLHNQFTDAFSSGYSINGSGGCGGGCGGGGCGGGGCGGGCGGCGG